MDVRPCNCLIANLTPKLKMFGAPAGKIFWPLVDIDSSYQDGYMNLCINYLQDIGLYDTSIWCSFESNSYQDFVRVVTKLNKPFLIMAAPIRQVKFRQDIGNQVYMNGIHAFTLNCNTDPMSMSDPTVGSMGERIFNISFTEQSLGFDSLFYIFDFDKFLSNIGSVDMESVTKQYQLKLIDNYTINMDYKIKTFHKGMATNSLDRISTSNLYEHSFNHRIIFEYQFGLKATLTPLNTKYRGHLSKLKHMSYKMPFVSTDKRKSMLLKYIDNELNNLQVLDEIFYEIFAQA